MNNELLSSCATFLIERQLSTFSVFKLIKSGFMSILFFHHVILGVGFPPATLQQISISLPILYGPSVVDRVPFNLSFFLVISVITGLNGGTMTLKLISDSVAKPMLTPALNSSCSPLKIYSGREFAPHGFQWAEYEEI